MKTKKLLVCLLTFVTATCLLISGFSVYKTVSAQEGEVENVIASIEDEYRIGSVIEVPDAYFTDGGNQVKATKTIIYPNGSKFRKNEFTPNEMGEYSIEYSAKLSTGLTVKR